jgi:hypothetical protein
MRQGIMAWRSRRCMSGARDLAVGFRHRGCVCTRLRRIDVQVRVHTAQHPSPMHPIEHGGLGPRCTSNSGHTYTGAMASSSHVSGSTSPVARSVHPRTYVQCLGSRVPKKSPARAQAPRRSPPRVPGAGTIKDRRQSHGAFCRSYFTT